MRACFQVLTIPYRYGSGRWEFAVLKRGDAGYWQFVAGGGEEGETPIQAARREAAEEAGIDAEAAFAVLDTVASIPRECFPEAADWPAYMYVIPEHCFATDVGEAELHLSHELMELRWVGFDEARAMLKWDSNRTALYELNERLKDGNIVGARAGMGAAPRAAQGNWAETSEDERMADIERIAVLDDEAQALLLATVLKEEGIPHAIVSHRDSAYDGLFQAGRGWGHVEAPAEFRTRILEVLQAETEWKGGMPQ